MEPDFRGWATKYGVKCSDGRVINPKSFSAQNGQRVPLVWQHGHDTPSNVLGHVVLEDRAEGIYASGYFNTNPKAVESKQLVEHRDLDSLSIYANRLVEQNKAVSHGVIREVSLVLAGANPEAKIDHVTIRHSDGSYDELEDEAVIVMGVELEHASGNDKTVGDVLETLDEEQMTVVNYLISQASKSVSHADSSDDDKSDSDDSDNKSGDDQSKDSNKDDKITHKEGEKVNVFEKTADDKTEKHSLSHDDMKAIVADAQKSGSLKAAVEGYALAHGIENLESLFPDPKLTTDRPEFLSRRTEWVAGVLAGVRRSPFSRIKTRFADLTFEAARAKGYIKGTLKKEEFFGLLQRVTTPTTIYKKQKLDRDDMIDITDFDVVAWLKWEMRFMLEEEIARAILVGDGRAIDDDDKIRPENLRPIAYEDELYAPRVEMAFPTGDSATNGFIDQVISARALYKGTGTPTFYTTETLITRMLLLRDGDGKRLYRSIGELTSELRVNAVVAVEVMEDHPDIIGILVNLSDYRLGADRGGEVTMFDDFDIDYNQYKYLIETRISGCLDRPRSAVIFRKASATLATPTKPAFNQSTNVLTIPTTTGIDYKIDGVTKAAGTYTLTKDTYVDVVAKDTYYVPTTTRYQYSPTAE
jgi:hypothetical protein